MVHIVLLILKITGIVLLALLILILLVLLSVLFVPVRYRGEFQKRNSGMEDMNARGKISWMAGAVSLRFEWREQKMRGLFRIFGVPVFQFPAQKGKKEKKDAASPKARDTGKAGDSAQERGKKDGVQGGPERKPPELEQKDAERQTKIPENETGGEILWEKAVRLLGLAARKILRCLKRIVRLAAGILDLPGRICRYAGKLGQKGKRLLDSIGGWKRFLDSEPFRQGVKTFFGELWRLVKSIRPRKIQGQVSFGFEDPADTGQALALVSLCYPVLPKKLNVTPVFEETVFRADLCFSGRIYGAVLVRFVWCLYRDRNIRIIYRKFQRKEA